MKGEFPENFDGLKDTGKKPQHPVLSGTVLFRDVPVSKSDPRDALSRISPFRLTILRARKSILLKCKRAPEGSFLFSLQYSHGVKHCKNGNADISKYSFPHCRYAEQSQNKNQYLHSKGKDNILQNDNPRSLRNFKGFH